MEKFSRAKLLECLNERGAAFNAKFKVFKEEFLKGNQYPLRRLRDWIHNAMLTFKQLLLGDELQPMSKIYIIKMLKDCFETGFYPIVILIEVEILPVLRQICLYKKASTDQSRGKSYFTDRLNPDQLSDAKLKDEYEKVGNSYLRFVLECVEVWAQLKPHYYLTDIEVEEQPSSFASVYNQLKNIERVTFPDKRAYFKEEEIVKARMNFKNMLDDLLNNTVSYVDYYTIVLADALQKPDLFNGDNIKTLRRLQQHPDVMLVEEAMKILRDNLESKASPTAKIHSIRLLTEMFEDGLLEVVHQTEQYIPHLETYLGTLDQKNTSLKRGEKALPIDAASASRYYASLLRSLILWSEAVPKDPFDPSRESKLRLAYLRLSKKYEFPVANDEEIRSYRNNYLNNSKKLAAINHVIYQQLNEEMRSRQSSSSVQRKVEPIEKPPESNRSLSKEAIPSNAFQKPASSVLPKELPTNSVIELPPKRAPAPPVPKSIAEQHIKERFEVLDNIYKYIQSMTVAGENEDKGWLKQAVDYCEKYNNTYEEYMEANLEMSEFDERFDLGYSYFGVNDKLSSIFGKGSLSYADKLKHAKAAIANMHEGATPGGAGNQDAMKQDMELMKVEQPSESKKKLEEEESKKREEAALLKKAEEEKKKAEEEESKKKEEQRRRREEEEKRRQAEAQRQKGIEAQKQRQDAERKRRAQEERQKELQLQKEREEIERQKRIEEERLRELEKQRKLEQEQKQLEEQRIKEEQRRLAEAQRQKQIERQNELEKKSAIQAAATKSIQQPLLDSNLRMQSGILPVELRDSAGIQQSLFSVGSSDVKPNQQRLQLPVPLTSPKFNTVPFPTQPNAPSSMTLAQQQQSSGAFSFNKNPEKKVYQAEIPNELNYEYKQKFRPNEENVEIDEEDDVGVKGGLIGYGSSIPLTRNNLNQRYNGTESPLKPSTGVDVQKLDLSGIRPNNKTESKQSSIINVLDKPMTPVSPPIRVVPESNRNGSPERIHEAEDSQILEPGLEPLNQSFHDIDFKDFYSQVSSAREPNFKNCFEFDRFLIPNRTITGKEKVFWLEQDAQVLNPINRSMRTEPVRSITSQGFYPKKSTVVDRSMHSSFVTLPELLAERTEKFDGELKLLQDRHKRQVETLENKIKRLERELREKDRIVNEQQMEIMSMRELSSSGQGLGSCYVGVKTVSPQKAEYLEQENQLLKSRLKQKQSYTSGGYEPSWVASSPAPMTPISHDIENSIQRYKEGMKEPKGRLFFVDPYQPYLSVFVEPRLKKMMLKNKELIFQNEHIEIGAIISLDNTLKIALYVQGIVAVNDLLMNLSRTPAMKSNWYPERIASELQPGKQQRIIYSLELLQIPYHLPQLQFSYKQQ